MSSAAVGRVYHEQFLHHYTGPDHPERPDRLRAVVDGLEESSLWSRLTPIDFEPATPEAISLIHEPAYVNVVELACESDLEWLGSLDTTICMLSYDIARRAVGGVLQACDAVVDGKVERAFCAVRPPGHHAEVDRAMGFCLFNNIAIGAEHLVRNRGLSRVAIVDFDVHHGNGTQHAFEARDDVLFISLHEGPQFLYPGTGWPGETGTGRGEGYTLNIPFAPGASDDDYRRAFTAKVIPKLDSFRPEFLLVSAGFDAAAGENIAHLDLSPEAYAFMTRELVEVANRHAEGRLVSILEGGYELPNLKSCVSAHVRALLESA